VLETSFREIDVFSRRGGRSVFFVPVREGGREGWGVWKKSFREIRVFPRRGGRSVFFVPVRKGGREGGCVEKEL